ncbi:MAG: hypothetical protein V7K89_26940 [Nostoc sp.]|uniref:hypothetical protein n=1 Tax=Nostoc sp. TaxID=1180 RepID=UPI002FF946DA
MSSEQHLQHKRHALQEHYDLLAEKLKKLRRDYAIAADTLIRFQLEKQNVASDYLPMSHTKMPSCN